MSYMVGGRTFLREKRIWEPQNLDKIRFRTGKIFIKLDVGIVFDAEDFLECVADDKFN